MAPNANQITLKPEELSVDGIKQFYVDCRSQARENSNRKYEILVGLYSLLTVSQSIIFVKVLWGSSLGCAFVFAPFEASRLRNSDSLHYNTIMSSIETRNR